MQDLKRIIARIDVKGGRLIKGVRFEGLRVIGDPEKAAIKFFFYLTDVDSKNGCLGYIPGSHKISFYLKKMILKKLLY